MPALPKSQNDSSEPNPKSQPPDNERFSLSDAPPTVLPAGTEGSLYWRVRGLVRTTRPHQWVKNVFVLAPVVFAKELVDRDLVLRAAQAFLVFCVLTGCVYTINDIVDAPSDRVHPIKRRRPIASGQVPVRTAKVLAVLLFVVAMGGALSGPPLFALVAILYFLINIAYSFKLKNIAYLDVACIAAGFVLRVIAGGLATYIEVSGYLLACTALLALFLGFGKRRHELATVLARQTAQQRSSLQAYTPAALSTALTLTGFSTIGTYVAYTLDPATRQMFHSNSFWLTAINPVFGVLRFLQLVRSRPKAESPTQEMLRDTTFVLNVVVWIVLVIVLVYKPRPSAGF
jgi:decaprenyl-phosphate phosphoribosyltransferase